MSKHLVIVESPTKAKTIRKFLPKAYVVEASMGHIRDLPESAAAIPKEYKKEAWARIGVNVDKNFEPLYVVPKEKSKVIAELKKKLKEADVLYLATDEDREGESIAWHLAEVLKPKIPVKRMVFNEITKPAIERALREVRSVDMKLVRAQETRRILDRLVGYSLSPLLWKKIAFGLSAGRVQSVALRVLVQRERARSKFKSGTYADLLANLSKDQTGFTAKLIEVAGKRIATGKDFDENTGGILAAKASEVRLLSEADAAQVLKTLSSKAFVAKDVVEKPFQQKPAAPFITSTLQQEANRKLGLSAKQAMRTAQRLYEEGFITYMRTDSPSLSQEAIGAARETVERLYGKEYLSKEVRQYAAKGKGAQEAHEAIRPAGSDFVHPDQTGLRGDERALYEMIWKRTVATQMAEAKKTTVSVRWTAQDTVFSSAGTRIEFAGFLRAYVEGSDDPEAALEEKEGPLPDIRVGESLLPKSLSVEVHETKAPARFTEASLVQMLEKEGIGRPSTYASIIGTILDRGYVKKLGQALAPTFTGFAVTQLLENHFNELVDTGFTSKMEESLDDIAAGELEWLPYLQKFYLGSDGLAKKIERQEKSIDPEKARTVELPQVEDVTVKIGRFGPYLVKAAMKSGKTKGAGEEDIRATIPEDFAPADLTTAKAEDLLLIQQKGPEPIGKHPQTGEFIYCLVGRFGPYVQLGEVSEQNPKPRRASLPKGFDPKAVGVDDALKWLSLPRELGVHPEKGKAILANNGRFGPYVVCDGDFRSLKKTDDVYTVSLERALELLSQEKKRRGAAEVLKDLGPHPKDQKPVHILEGKYGPYVKHGEVNATVPKDKDPEKLSMEEAVALLMEREASGASKSKGRRYAKGSQRRTSRK